jgi:hypothetical protein
VQGHLREAYGNRDSREIKEDLIKRRTPPGMPVNLNQSGPNAEPARMNRKLTDNVPVTPGSETFSPDENSASNR